MEWLLWLIYFTLLYLCTCLVIICTGDCDILTFFYSKLGSQPVKAYQNKVVWITGASSGIGEGIAKELAQCATAKMILSARRKQELERVKAECLSLNREKSGDTILVVPFDMTDYFSHKVALDKILHTFGKLDILISNAGRSQRAKWDEIEATVDKALFDINVFSLVHLNRIVLRYYLGLTKPRGQLAVVSSIAGKIGFPNSASYTGSKFALHGYFECLRNEMRGQSDISITIVCPGPVSSAALREAFTGKQGQKVAQDQSPTHSKMTPTRCGYMTLVSIANELEETWVSPSLHLSLVYLATYQPFIFAKFIAVEKYFGLFAKLRDNGKD